jgi:flagellar biosynthesis component FlhA
VPPSGELRAVTLAPLVDLTFAKAEREGRSFDPFLVSELASFLQRTLADAEMSGVVLLTSRATRRLVRELLTLRRVEIAVLCFDEIVDEVKIIPVATFSPESKEGEDDAQVTALAA